MPNVSLKKVVLLSAQDAFVIAADVSSYKDFLPLVTRSTVRGQVLEQGDIKRFAADLMIAVEKLGMCESFTSQVEVNAAVRTVVATSQDGPMKNLKAVWHIIAIDGARSTVSIDIDYEFRSKLLQLAAGGLMNKAIGRVMDAFEARGRQLYPLSALPNI